MHEVSAPLCVCVCVVCVCVCCVCVCVCVAKWSGHTTFSNQKVVSLIPGVATLVLLFP